MPTASKTAPLFTSRKAASISGEKCRSSTRCGTTSRTNPRTASSAGLDRNGAWKSHPCAAASSSIPMIAEALSAMPSRRRAPWAAMET